MTIAQSYAKALFALIEENPGKGKIYLANLRSTLKRKGHEKLLPHIFRELEHIELARERARHFKEPTQERERTRVLYELYKKLTASSGAQL